jgi:membrane protein DedA with SNARE-associated domain
VSGGRLLETGLPLATLHPVWIGLAVLAPLVYLVRRRRSAATPRRALPVAVLAVVVGVVLGSGLVEIPTLEDLPLQEWIGRVGDALGNWAYLIVGVLAFVETGAFVGLIAPGETFVLLGGVLAGEGTLRFGTLLAVVWAAAFLGDLASFYLGHRLGRGFLERHGPRFKITADRLAHVERFLERHGGKAIVIGRFIGFVRAVAPFILGSSGVRWRRFVPYAIVGSGLWSALFVGLGYVFWQSLDRLLGWVKQGAFAFGTVVVVVVAIVAVVHWLGEEEHREQARGWLRTAAGTRGGRALLAIWRPISGPARFVGSRLTPGGLGLEATTLVAVVAVGAFAYAALAAHLGHHATTGGDRWLLRRIDDLRVGPVEGLARVGVVLGSTPLVAVVAVLAAGLLVVRRRVRTAVTLVAAASLALVATAVARAAEDRPGPSGAIEMVSGSSFPSSVAAGAVVWVGVAVALTPAVRRIPGRIGLTGLAVVLAVAVSFSTLVLREAYLSDVLSGAGLAAATMAAVGLVALVVAHLRHDLGE